MSPRTERLLWVVTLAVLALWVVAAVAWFAYAITVEMRALHMLEAR